MIGENVGSQDQIWASYGGMNRVDFHPDGAFDVRPLIVSPKRRKDLAESFLLFFTGLSRIASEVAGRKIAKLHRRKSHIRRMVELVDEGEAILADETRPVSGIGEMLHEAWCLKRELADGITTRQIDAIYEAALDAGATGGKLLGAGGGGFLLFQVPAKRRNAVRERLADLISVSVNVDSSGSKIVVFEPDGSETR